MEPAGEIPTSAALISQTAPPADDWLTVAAIGALAYMVANVLHEGVGHGGVALLSGAHRLLFDTVEMETGRSTRWIAAAGTLVNLAVAALLWPVLCSRKIWSPHLRYFLVLVFAFNLFTGTGYFLFSGITGFGDWQEVIQGISPAWLWRTALTVVGIIAYGCAMRWVGALLRPYFGAQRTHSPRCRVLTLTPYVAAGAIALLAGLRNPHGLPLILESAMPSTLGANFGLLNYGLFRVPGVMPPAPSLEPDPGPIRRSFLWISLACVFGLPYIFILGRGVHLSRG